MRALVTVVLAALLWTPAASPALANGLPVRTVDRPAGLLIPDSETPVGVVSETLEFDFRDASPNGFVWLPRVTAAYRLRNPSAAEQRLTVAFVYLDRDAGDGPRLPDPLPEELQRLQVSWRGQPLPASAAEPTGFPLGPLELHWLDPGTGERYAVHPAVGATLKVAVSSFEIEPAGEGVLEVRFRQRDSGCDECNRRIGEPIWHYTYLLRPARHWAFFGELTVRVLAPPGMLVAAEPALDRIAEGRWERTFPALPEGDLHLSIRPPGHARELWIAWILGAALGAAGVGVVGLLRARRARRRPEHAGPPALPRS